MKKIFKESLLKSILVTSTIALAIASILIIIHSCIATKENNKWLNQVNNCIIEGKDCEKKWENKEYDSNWVDVYNNLKKRYSNEMQIASYWNRKNHFECSLIWFEFYRNLVLFNLGLGIIIGIILHIAYNMKKEKKKKN